MACVGNSKAHVHIGYVSGFLTRAAFTTAKGIKLTGVFSLASAKFQAHHPRHISGCDQLGVHAAAGLRACLAAC
jgi:hypothetical protein